MLPSGDEHEDRKRHIGWGFVTGIAKHYTLIAALFGIESLSFCDTERYQETADE